ncbi:MAG: GH116 family glycosyl hydrolase [Bryobacteraceae bacterium]
MKGFIPALALVSAALHAQGIPKFPIEAGPLEISGPVNSWRFINAVGEKSGAWGYESGRLEGWVYPLKIFHDFHLTFEMEGLPRTYEGDQIVRSVRVFPHAVQLLYAAEQFSVEETLFAPRQDAGFAILLDVRAPSTLRIRACFRPDLNLMWPGGIGGQTAGWDASKKWVQLSEASSRFSALIGSPLATASTAVGYHAYLPDQQPYEEIELVVTPEQARSSYVPIIVTGGIRGIYDAAGVYQTLLREMPRRFQEAREHYDALDSGGTQFQTPEPVVDRAMRWARVSLEQLKICNPYLGCSYVSGYGSSGTGTRPMYAWFFEEPTITTLAYLGGGQAEQLREAFRFIRKYQRSDGKIPHEISQSAGVIDWFKDYPFSYIHPDSPLWYVIAMGQYYRVTGDRHFLEESWPSIRKAYHYGVSLLDPVDGLPTIPKGEWGSMETAAFNKDAAMAGEWIAALAAMSEMSGTLGDRDLASECARRKEQASTSLEQFWNPESSFYNYGLDSEGHMVTNLNPAIGLAAWLGSLPDAKGRAVTERLATGAFLSDWGQRNMSLEDPRYREGDYQMGSVWPVMTFGPMLADFRYHNAVQGYLTWMSMVRLGEFNARGAMPEVLSGASYRLIDNSVPHQMFSEMAVIPGLINGVFGLEPDVPRRALAITPHMPPDWPECSVSRFPYGGDKLAVRLRRSTGVLAAELEFSGTQPISVRFSPALPAGAEGISLEQDGHSVPFQVEDHSSDVHATAKVTVAGKSRIEVKYRGGVAVQVAWHPVLEGEASSNLRVLRSVYRKPRLEMLIEGLPGRAYEIMLFTPWQVKSGGLKVDSGSRDLSSVQIAAPAGHAAPDKAGYVRWTAGIDLAQ